MDEDALIARYIEPNPHKSGVAEVWVVGAEGHVVPIWAIIGHYLLAVNQDADQVAFNYDMPREAIDAALAYYRRHKCAIDARIEANAA